MAAKSSSHLHGPIAGLLALGLGAPAGAHVPGWFDTASRAYAVGNPAQAKTYRPTDHVVVDLDGDGDLDVVHSTTDGFFPSGSADFVVSINRGDGRFDPASFVSTPGGRTACVTAGDLDGDGDADLAFGQTDVLLSGQRVLLFFNDGTGHFGPQMQVACGKGPTDILAVDVDGDQDLDLVTANQATGVNTVSVLKNSGSGTFPQRQDFAAGDKPVWLDHGDLDQDGDIDLLVVSGTGPTKVRVMTNNGAGAFALGAQFSGQNMPRDAALADVDADGDLDIVHTGGPDQVFTTTAVLYRNDGSGGFSAGGTIPLGISFGAHRLEIGDATGDGHLDLMITHFGPSYGWLLVPGKGDGTFFTAQAFGSGQETSTITLADMDGDGDGDVVITNEHSKTMTVHENRQGSFALPPVATVAQLTTELDIADLDLDGDLDVVTAESTIHVLYNNGDGTFQNTSFAPLLSRFRKVRLRDLDGDGYPDLLLAKETCCPPYFLYTAMNDGTGHFAGVVAWPIANCGGNEIETLDFDNDGDLDVAFSEALGCMSVTFQRIFLFENQGNGTFIPPVEMPNPLYAGAMFMQAGDYDGDGNTDLAIAAGNLLIQRGNGDGTFQPPASYAPSHGLTWMKAADMNGDGHLDIAYSSTGEGTIGLGGTCGVMLNDGSGAFVEADFEWEPFALGLKPEYGCDVLDADQDGKLDVVVGGISQDDVLLFRGNGDGTLEAAEHYGMVGHVNLIRAGDFTGDGAADVAALVTTFPPIGQAHVSILEGLGQTGCGGQSISYGAGCPGSGAITPTLTSLGCPAPSATLSVTISSGLGGSTAVMLFGGGTTASPIGGGCQLLISPLLPLALSLPLSGSGAGAGTRTLSAPVPPSASGLTVTLQAFVGDPASPIGFSATPGLKLVFP